MWALDGGEGGGRGGWLISSNVSGIKFFRIYRPVGGISDTLRPQIETAADLANRASRYRRRWRK